MQMRFDAVRNISHKIQGDRIWRSGIAWAVGINAAFLAAILLLCDLKYEVSDDFVMASILSGAYNGGEPDPHMIFVNVLIGYILIPFYKLFPQISWYFIFQLALLFVSFVMASYMLIEKNGRAVGGMLAVMLLTLFADDAYILMQFTKTASVAVMCASIVFVWSLFAGRKKILTVASGLLCLAGTMLRFLSIYLAGGFLLVILAVEFFRLYQKREGKAWVRKGAVIALCGAALIGASYLCREINSMSYRNSEEYSEFMRFNSLRSRVVDAADKGYAAYREEMEELDISENDYWLLRRWSFADEEVFTREKLEQVGKVLAAHKEAKPFAPGNIYEAMQARGLLAYPAVIACICLLALTVVLQRYRWIFGVACMGIAVLLEVYFFHTDRVIYRVEYGIFLCAFLGICYFWDRAALRFKESAPTEGKKELTRLAAVATAGFLMWELPLFWENSAYEGVTDEYRKVYLDETFYDSWSYDARKYRRVVNKGKPENSLLLEIEGNKENFYFLDFRTTIQTLYYEWSPFENIPPGFYENCLYFGGITSSFPGTDEIAAEYGVHNFFRDLVKENVYIVDNENVEARLQYLQEHYYPDARVELYKEAGGYQIWKFFEEQA